MMKETKLLAALLIIVASLSLRNANAQTTGDSKLRFGIGVDGLLPVGNLTGSENFGLGITPRLQYRLSDKLALTFTSGFYHFFPKNVIIPTGALGEVIGTYKFDLDIVPVKLGLKVFVSKNIYLAGEAGAGFEVEDGGGPVKLILSPAVGYACKHWDLGVRYENFSGSNSGNYGMLGLRVAYGFGL